MQTISLKVDTQGKITLPLWLQHDLRIGAGSQVKVTIEKETPIKAEKSAFKSDFGMFKTSLPPVPVDFDVSVFAKDK